MRERERSWGKEGPGGRFLRYGQVLSNLQSCNLGPGWAGGPASLLFLPCTCISLLPGIARTALFTLASDLLGENLKPSRYALRPCRARGEGAGTETSCAPASSLARTQFLEIPDHLRGGRERCIPGSLCRLTASSLHGSSAVSIKKTVGSRCPMELGHGSLAPCSDSLYEGSQSCLASLESELKRSSEWPACD